MNEPERLRELQIRNRRLRSQLETLTAQIHAQVAENERLKRAITDEDDLDEEEAV